MISGHFGWGEAGWGEGAAAVVTPPPPEPVDPFTQWTAGSVNLTQASAAVVGVGTQWSGNVSAGHLFLAQLPDELEASVVYEIGGVSSADLLTLRAPWQGRTVQGAPYLIHRRTGSLPRLRREDQGIAPLMTYTLAAIDRALVVGQPPGPVGGWLLATGAWDDAGHWDDTADWQD